MSDIHEVNDSLGVTMFKKNVMKPPESNDDSDNSSSPPDSRCVICLGKLRNKSFTDSCLHEFCFSCLVKWSKVKAECPLCKQHFKSIIHNVRSNEDYDQYHVPGPEASITVNSFMSYNIMLDIFNYASTRSTPFESEFLNELIRNHEGQVPSIFPSRRSGAFARSFGFRPPHRSSVHFRRAIYHKSWWVRPLAGGFRESNPNFYRCNPAQVHRLAPWINREVDALLPDEPFRARAAVNKVLRNLEHFEIGSDQFRISLQVFFAGYTDHFMHELGAFARSPYDMPGFDNHASYERRLRNRQTLSPIIVDTSTSNNEPDSDVEVLDVVATPRDPPVVISISDSDSDVEIVPDYPDEIWIRDEEPQPGTSREESGSSSRNVNNRCPLSLPLRKRMCLRDNHTIASPDPLPLRKRLLRRSADNDDTSGPICNWRSNPLRRLRVTTENNNFVDCLCCSTDVPLWVEPNREEENVSENRDESSIRIQPRDEGETSRRRCCHSVNQETRKSTPSRTDRASHRSNVGRMCLRDSHTIASPDPLPLRKRPLRRSADDASDNNDTSRSVCNWRSNPLRRLRVTSENNNFVDCMCCSTDVPLWLEPNREEESVSENRGESSVRMQSRDEGETSRRRNCRSGKQETRKSTTSRSEMTKHRSNVGRRDISRPSSSLEEVDPRRHSHKHRRHSSKRRHEKTRSVRRSSYHSTDDDHDTDYSPTPTPKRRRDKYKRSTKSRTTSHREHSDLSD